MFANCVDIISVDFTDKCNLCCRHCFNYSGTRKVDYYLLSDSEILSFMNDICELDISSCCVCGGEPMLRKDLIYSAVNIVKNNSSSTMNMVSNGLLIGKKEAKSLKESKIDNVQISLDGFEEAHNWLRMNNNAFQYAVDAIDNLLYAGCEVGVACTPNKKNLADIPQLIEFLHDKGIRDFRMQPIMRMGRAKEIQDFYPTNQDYIHLIELLEKYRRIYKNMIVEWGDPTEHLGALSKGKWLKSIAINSYGDIMISPYIPISFGNIKEHSLQEYLDEGLADVVKNDVLKHIFSLATDALTLDVSSKINLPELYGGSIYNLDLFDSNINDKFTELAERLN